MVFEELPEIGTGTMIRKVAAIPSDFSLAPRAPLGSLSLAEHVLGFSPQSSPYLSASSKPFGTPTMDGVPLLLDVAKIRAAGGQVYTVPEILRDLQRFATENPSAQAQVNKLIWAIERVEGEVLISGTVPRGAIQLPSAAHRAYVQAAEDLWKSFREARLDKAQLEAGLLDLDRAYARARVVGRVGRVLTVVGLAVTVYDVAKASQPSIETQSFKPLGAEAIRQVGGWGGAFVGAKVAFGVGALFLAIPVRIC